MLIELQEPFKSIWRQAYLRVESTGRKYLSLYNSQGDQTSISYARYLMCVHLGYILPPELEVDHKNDDCTDDRIENLQVLTQEENRIKQQWYYTEYVQNHYGFQCAACKLPFILTERELKMRLTQTQSGLAFCSKECSLWFIGSVNPVLDISIQNKIKELRAQGLSGYKIASQLGINRNTVMKYW